MDDYKRLVRDELMRSLAEEVERDFIADDELRAHINARMRELVGWAVQPAPVSPRHRRFLFMR